MNRSSLPVLGLVAITLLGSACAHVGNEQYETDMAELRRMLEEGDRLNSERSDGLESRISRNESELDGLEDRLRELVSDLGDMSATIERMDAAIRVHTPIYFGFDESEVRATDQPLLVRFGDVVSRYYPEATITVEGFTDPTGSDEYNLRLGQRRAESVRSILLEQGLTEEMVRAVSYGEDTRRLMTNAGGPGTSGRENRRVVLVIEGPRTSEGVITDSGSGT